MSEIRIESFSHLEGPVETFLALPRAIEGLTENQAEAEAAGTRSLLDPANTYYRNASSRCFLAYRGDRPVGRLTAFHNELLVEKEGPYGLVGHFACKDDVGAARALIDAAGAWLAEVGLKWMRGPMAGDIWHRWRFMTRGFDTTSFPGEPRQPEYYPRLFLACGFATVRTYSTKRIEDLPAQLKRFRFEPALAKKRGITFRTFDKERWDEDVHALYVLCQHSFASSWSVTPTTEEEFANIYNRWLHRVGPDEILLAEDSAGKVVGLGLSMAKPADTLNIRTLAVLPEYSGYGIGQAITAELYRRAIDKGMVAVHHCLMGPTTPPQRWDHGHGRVTREYAMYERGIGG